MFPLSTVLFPYAPLPLHVFEPRYRQLVADCLDGEREFGVVLIARGSEVGGGDERLHVGTVAHIDQAAPLPGDRWALVTHGTRRIRVTEWLPDQPYPRALVEGLDRGASSSPASPVLDACDLDGAFAVVRRARALLSEMGTAPALGPDLALGPDPAVAAWQLCALTPLGPLDAQRLLETEDPAARVREVARLAGESAEDLRRLLAQGRG